MRHLKIDLISGEPTSASYKNKTSPAKLIVTLLSVAGVFVFSFGVGRMSLSPSATAALASLNEIPFFRQMHLIGSPDRRLAGEDEDRVNVLLMGMGGEGHEGPLLTDTMMIASLRPSDRKVTLLSIPRDLAVPLPKYGWRKINAANAYGEMDSSGQGAEFARSTVEGLLGIDVPYFVRIDFDGFRKIIDDIGGVEIAVEKPFTDVSYPDSKHGYQAIAFQAGLQHMDGETALQYARSRHGNNGEGSDFARAKRQQKVMAAIKTKVMSETGLRNATTISNLLADLRSNISTNLQVGELLRLAKMGKEVQPENIAHQVIDDRPGSPLVSAYMNGAFVMVPRNDDWSLLRDVAANVFNTAKTDAADLTDAGAINPVVQTTTVDAPSAVADEPANVEILNGSGTTDLARSVTGKLTKYGFVVVRFGNADSNNYRRTLVLDLTGGKKNAALETLKTALGSGVGTADPRTWRGQKPTGVDFLVILGQDAANP